MRASSDASTVLALPLRRCHSDQNGRPYFASSRCMALSRSPGPRLSRWTIVRTYSVAASTLIGGTRFLDFGNMVLGASRYLLGQQERHEKGHDDGTEPMACRRWHQS